MQGLKSPQAGTSVRPPRRRRPATRRATDAQVLEDAERLIAAWDEHVRCCPESDHFAAMAKRQGSRGHVQDIGGSI